MTNCDDNLDDIEDIVSIKNEEKHDIIQESSLDYNIKLKRFDNNKSNINGYPDKPQTTLVDSIPGTQTIYVKTWGCSHNISDSEYMSGLLKNYGYNIITKERNADDADLWLLNSCTVKGPSQDHFMTQIRKAKSKNKHIVAGTFISYIIFNYSVLKNTKIYGISGLCTSGRQEGILFIL